MVVLVGLFHFFFKDRVNFRKQLDSHLFSLVRLSAFRVQHGSISYIFLKKFYFDIYVSFNY